MKRGIACWMDIKGGMSGSINEAMAEGVENAACILPFMTQAYQDSKNCKKELTTDNLKTVKQSGLSYFSRIFYQN